jgi:hypothetical protein
MSNEQMMNSEGLNNSELMSSILPPHMDPASWEFFAFIVDNEVAHVFPIYKNDGAEAMIAAFSSFPVVMKLNEEDKLNVHVGYMLDENTGKFNQPPGGY